MTFHLTCVHIIFSSVWVAQVASFGKLLLTRLTKCSLCILNICNFPFGLEGWIWVLTWSLHTFYFIDAENRKPGTIYIPLMPLELRQGSSDI